MNRKKSGEQEKQCILLSIHDQQFAPCYIHIVELTVLTGRKKRNTILKHLTEILLSFIEQCHTHIESLSLAELGNHFSVKIIWVS